jgi:hypothetical protein
MKKLCILLLVFLVGFTREDSRVFLRTLNWQVPCWEAGKETQTGSFIHFEGCDFGDDQLPWYAESFQVKSNQATFAMVQATFKEYPDPENYLQKIQIPDTFRVLTNVVQSRNQYSLHVRILPIKKSGGRIYLLTGFSFRIGDDEVPSEQKSALVWQTESVLQSGKWIKVTTSGKGIFRIPFSRLQNWGFSNPEKVCVYGNGGAMLPETVQSSPPDGLAQVAAWSGKDAGGNDCLFFYNPGNITWQWKDRKYKFIHKQNIYSRQTSYFLTQDSGSPKEVVLLPAMEAEPDGTVDSFNEYTLHERERRNLIKSGQQWFGETFVRGIPQELTLSCPGREENSPVQFEVNAAGRSSSASTLQITIHKEEQVDMVFNAVNTGDATSLYADEKNRIFETTRPGEEFTLRMMYSAVNSSAEAWLDYIRVNYRRKMEFTSPEFYFRNAESVDQDLTLRYKVDKATAGLKVFDVTEGGNIYDIPVSLEGSQILFTRPADEVREYLIFNPESNFPEPEWVGEIANQNLHALPVPEMIVITHPDFYEVASALASFHQENDGMAVEVVNTTEVYHEFSSGIPDASGIRNFIKMLYDKDRNRLKYVLLMGDGSYDNRNLTGVNRNFIPTYQSLNSLTPTGSFVSDDYFVLLDEGETVYNGAVDLGIGRLPVSTSYEAEVVLQKIKTYNSPPALGSWRNTVCFIADDEDGTLHMKDSDSLANLVNSKYPAFITSKIYFDAYPEEATPAGERYPGVTEAINQSVKDGVLILNYVGHANERFMADEHVLDVSTINSWSNKNNLPIFVTATCEFSRFDADETSAGEYVLLNPSGGGIGLFSTTRVVFAYSNFLLNKSFYDHVFEQDASGNHSRMGDIIRLAKKGVSGTNKRNFSLLADPALRLSYPRYRVITSTINQKDAHASMDTVKALNQITIEGYIADYYGNKQHAFNGEIIPVVYDKAFRLHTLGNGGQRPMEFTVQDNIIYKGRASVINGEFSFRFMVPKDIAYNLGQGKIIYYARNETEDAHGAFENFLIGGSSGDQVTDHTGPEVELYLDDESFVSGDETSKNPILLAYVSDENGMNTVGTGIGHDIAAILDGDKSNSLILNDYYQANMDDYTSGIIEYPLKGLSEGEHTLTLKVWDVANNSTETTIRFVVTGDFYIREVGNYPNPVVDYTFFRFAHNQPDATFDGLIEIFDANGRIVDSFQRAISSNGMESNPLRWDVTDAKLPVRAGIYIYRISIKSSNGEVTWKSGKMNILR